MATMLVIFGDNEGEWFTLGRRPMVFGRDRGLLGGIDDPCVSRRHLEVRYDDIQRCFFAIDLHSRNGVVINGERIEDFAELHDDDLIQIGETLMVFSSTNFDDDAAAKERIEQCHAQHADAIDALFRQDQNLRLRLLQGTRVVPGSVRV